MNSDLLAVVCDAADEFLARLRPIDAASDTAGVANVMNQLLSQLSATGIWGPDNRLPSSELWKRAGDVLSVGSLQLHARTKPFGYAGDFEMLARISVPMIDGAMRSVGRLTTIFSGNQRLLPCATARRSLPTRSLRRSEPIPSVT